MDSKSSLGLSEKMKLIRLNMFQMNFPQPATAITSALPASPRKHSGFEKESLSLNMFRVKDYINIDKEILSGNPVFKGTRVPIQTLFDHLEKGISLDEFLEDFPTVMKQQAVAVIEIASKLLTSKNIEQIYETAA